jgi:UPF0755 protein
MTKKFKITIAIIIVLLLIAVAGLIKYSALFAAPQKQAEPERFIVSLNSTGQDVIQKLLEQGFIKSEWGFKYVLGKAEVQPGGYKIAKNMNAWKVAKILASEPYMKWIVIPEGLRKEEIGEILAEELGWNEEQKSDWTGKYTAMQYDYVEGVYFPDTYLIPKDEAGLQIAQRFIDKFSEKFAPYADKFIKENIKWTTALKIASLVQREAAGKNDMPLIAGILWNRLLKGMKLEVDATVQYARGKTENGWWSAIKPEDKAIDSPYNTYLYKGLPPHPICNPGLDAIDAVLNSAETECLYYLHDENRQIHCAETYDQHRKNIEQFLQ